MSFLFEWDRSKAEGNAKKHGVGFDEALTVFADPLARIFSDPDHSDEEHRDVIIGHSATPRLILVCFTERESKIRIINARTATSRERQDYEQNSRQTS